MNPYRIKGEKQHIADEPPRYEDDIPIVWVWFGIGAIMIMAGAMQPSPWGPGSSLGMLLSALASIALRQHYAAKWNARRKSAND
jgi:hypothetical protein